MRFLLGVVLLLANVFALAGEVSLWRGEGATRFTDGRLDPQEVGSILQEVLVRVSGTSAILEAPTVRSALADPVPMVEKRELVRSEGKRLRLAVEFAPSRLMSLLESAGVHVWEGRPKIMLVWMEGSMPAALSAVESTEVAAEAKRRGLPLMAAQGIKEALHQLPEGTELFLAPALMWQNLAKASGVTNLVLARVTAQADGSLLAEWRAIIGADSRLFSVKVGSRDEFLRLLPHALSELMAAAQQWPESGGGASIFRVDGVSGFGEYVGAQMALSRMGVRNINLLRIDGGLWFRGDLPEGALGSDPHLSQQAVSSEDNPLWEKARSLGCPLHVFRWVTEVAPVSGAG